MLLCEFAHTCFVLLASSAGLLDRLAPAALLLSAGRNTLGRSNSPKCSLGKLLYLEDEKQDCNMSFYCFIIGLFFFYMKFCSRQTYVYLGAGSGPSSAGGSGGITKTVCSLFWDSSSSKSLVSSDDSPSTCSEHHIQDLSKSDNKASGLKEDTANLLQSIEFFQLSSKTSFF